MVAGARITCSGDSADTGGSQRVAIPREAPPGNALVLRLTEGRLDTHDQEVAVAQAQQVLRRESGATLVVDHDRRVARPRWRVDHDRGQAGASDGAHLGVPLLEAQDHDAVHGRPIERAGRASRGAAR